jgi:putative ABC transport system permease protein
LAQLVPAVAGALLGIPGGIGLLVVIAETPRIPPLWQLLVLIPVTMIVVVVLTAIPARSGGRRPVAETLRGELA